MFTPSHGLEGESLPYAPALHGQRYRGAMQPGPPAVWNTPSAGDAWQIRRTNQSESRRSGAFLSCDSPNLTRPVGSLHCGLKWNKTVSLLLVIVARGGARSKGGAFSAAFPRFPTGQRETGSIKQQRNRRML